MHTTPLNGAVSLTRYARTRLGALTLGAVVMLGGAIEARADIDRAAAQQLAAQSGITAQLEGIESQVRSRMRASFTADQAKVKISPSDLENLLDAVRKSYDKDRMVGIVTSTLSRRLQREDVDSIGAWYSSATGVAVTSVEQRASEDTRPTDVQVREGMALLQRTPPSRQALLEDLVRTTRQVDVMINFMLGTAVAMQSGLAAFDPSVPARSVGQLREAVLQKQPNLQANIGRVAMAMSAKTYRNVREADLAAYVSFIKTPAAKHFYDAAAAGLEAALNSGALSIGREMGRLRSAGK